MKPIVEIVKSPLNEDGTPMRTHMSAVFKPDELINRLFMTAPNEHGQRFKATVIKKIVEQVENHQESLGKDPDCVKFIVHIDEEQRDEIVAYNKILRFIDEEIHGDEKMWKFKDIIAHEGPLKRTDTSYRGCPNNVKVAWEEDSVTYEPLTMIA